MLRVKIVPFSDRVKTSELIVGESLPKLVERVKKEFHIPDEIDEHIVIYIEDVKIERDKWENITIGKPDVDILFAIVPKGGDFRETARLIVITTAIVAAAYLGGTAAVALGGAYATGATIGAAVGGLAGTILTNSLLPPLPPEGIALGSLNSSGIEESQMYSLQAQTNKVNKYGFVPKVYGTHRFFPYVAANPYTELETDPTTGQLAQYFYAIFDFGLGPSHVSDIRIGNNPLTNFEDVTVRLVDPNRPVADEGVWDNQVYTNFEIYKGDRQSDQVSIPLNKDQDSGEPASLYQTIKNFPGIANGDPQELILDFYLPQGLNSFATNGTRGSVDITVDIQYAEVGTEDWHSYNDTVVTDGSFTTGNASELVQDIQLLNISMANPFVDQNTHPGLNYYDILNTVVKYPVYIKYADTCPFRHYTDTANSATHNDPRTHYYSTVGIAKGSTSFYMEWGIPAGRIVRKGSQTIGIVANSVQISGPIYRVDLIDPVPVDIELFTCHFVYVGNTTSPYYNLGWNLIYHNPISNYGWNPSSLPNVAIIDSNYYHNNVAHTLLDYVLQIPGQLKISGNSRTQLFATVKWTPIDPNKNYKVKVTRITTDPQYTFQVTSDLVLLNITNKFDRNPIRINSQFRHTFMELRIKATNQINGSLDAVSATVQSVLEVYDGANWNKELSNNPAWIVADLLTGVVNKRAVSKNRLDTASLIEWADFCDEIPPVTPEFQYTQPRFESNFILDFPTTLQRLVNRVSNMAQASLNIYDGKYGVLIDKNKTVPVQMFTPRNSWGFSSTRTYNELPHALRIKFLDPVSNWEMNNVIVYSPGYDNDTAVKFEEMETFGVTSFEQAGRYGRYMFAQAKLRKELITIEVDFENLVCTRGDYVILSHDVMRVGGTPARVRTVSGNQITIDDGIVVVAGSYGYTYRSVAGTFHTSTLTIVDSKTFDVDGDIPAVGDLIIIGIVDSISLDCIVKTIEPGADFTATLTLVEKAEAIYDSETEDPPDYNANLAPDVASNESVPDPVTNLSIVSNTWDCAGSSYIYMIDLAWDAPITGAYELFEIYVNYGDGYELHDFSSFNTYTYFVDSNNLGLEHKFKVLAVSATGKKLNLSDVSLEAATTPISKSTPPSDVGGLFLNVTGEVIQLNWEQISDCDLAEYLIRFVPITEGATWESSSPLLRLDSRTTMASVQSRVGTYLIKAVDFNGNESQVAARAITAIPELFNLNIIDERNDFPTLAGNKDTVEVFGNSLILKIQDATPPEQYFSEGYYYFEDLLDLGEIYTVRLQALIEAEGYAPSDLMSNWPTLEDVEAMSNSSFSDWAVDLEFRTTASLNVMSEWSSLEDVNALSSGDEDLWTEWKPFTIGDFTGRIFQFRVKLSSITPYYTPRVYSAAVRADMPDRVEEFNNLSATPSGLTVQYSPAFKGPGTSPNIQITQDNASQGDYYKLTNKTLESFDITFYDKNDTPVTRQFDAMIKGYGRKHTEVIG